MKNVRNKMMTEIKNDFEIDFRSDVYTENAYGNTPTMSYGRAKEIIKGAHKFVERNFGNVIEWNMSMEIEKLKTTPLKTYLDCLFEEALQVGV